MALEHANAMPGEAVASVWMTATGTFVVAVGLFIVRWKVFTKLVDSIRCMEWEKEWDGVEAELPEQFRNRRQIGPRNFEERPWTALDQA
ncbi:MULTISPECIES: hypothetical protein [unclassified Streptomyces]|uniref:hypothetical protein n=1 Tax=unclassified Streptomyces TaxID=2593676 RepID=UPI00224E913A|nr:MULTISPECIES: hypothetical protein [unclassified Streptomyces]MCX4784745.1 hypothetical protein [Streptomyces sp. NBC_01221]MCX4799297.1 hypothetical protein [Streptomyces sp. NBC_01242]WSJ40480.1 hypothetical protein OG772_33930 [Streptomyces sp. NBC_01321]WSP66797.1 hypothetical protein OG466_36675 [Streptomyces sp. NBC_01240]